MSKRYYHHKTTNIFKLDKTERAIIKGLIGVIKFLISFIILTCIDIYKLVKYIRKIIKNYYSLKKTGYNLEDIMNVIIYDITPRQFEVFCGELFKQHGYRVKITPPTKDGGVDIILDNHIFVECKHYKCQKITRPIIQKLLGSSMMYKGDKCIVITTGQYTIDAYKCKNYIHNLELMDLTDIQKMILDLKPEQISRIVMRTLNAS